jgi:hypothetical protein
VSDLYIPVIGPPIFLQQNMRTDRGNKQIAHRNMNVGNGTVAAQFLFWEYISNFRYSIFVMRQTADPHAGSKTPTGKHPTASCHTSLL